MLNIDVTVYLDGYHGDTSANFFAGDPPPAARRLRNATQEALEAAIAVCGPDVPVARIGDAVAAVAAKHKYGVSRDFIGHGVGKVFHAGPHVIHVKNSQRERMQLNSTFTIEPILVEGSPKMVEWKDGWTVVTADGSLAAQMEHTVLITPDGAEVLTVP
jgi:methionyl aminopeptidase